MSLSHLLNRIVPLSRRWHICFFQSNGRDEMLSVEDDKRLRVYSKRYTEGFAGQSWRIVSLQGGGTQWEPPHESELLTDDKRRDVLRAFCEHYDWIDERYVIEG